MLFAFHGPAYWYYTRVWGPADPWLDQILRAASTYDVIGDLDIALGITFLMVCVGVFAANLQHNLRAKDWRAAVSRWQHTDLQRDADAEKRLRVAALSIAVIVLLPFLIFDNQIGKTIDYFVSDVNEADKIFMRREGGGSGFYFYNLLLGTLFSFVGFALVGMRATGEKTGKTLFWIFVLLMCVAKASTLSKAPLAIYVLQIVLTAAMVKSLKISARTMAILLILMPLLMLFMIFIANVDLNFDSAYDFLIYRTLFVVNEGLVEYFSAIPHVIPHTWGKGFSWVASIFDVEPTLPIYWLVGEVHRGTLGSTTTVMFLGGAWADFSWVGVVVISFFAGFIVRWVDIALLIDREKSVFTMAGLSVVHYGIFIALSTSLQTAMITGGIALVPIFLLAFDPRARTRLRQT